MFKKLVRYIRHPQQSFENTILRYAPFVLSDKQWVRVNWRNNFGYDIDLSHPCTYNEKLQWLKLHDHNPLYTTLVDKYAVKEWVASKIGKEYVIPTLAVYNSVDEIDLDKLPNQFVLKCNHDSGSVVICRDKTSFNLGTAKIQLQKALKKNFYWRFREWAYKSVPRKIIAEQYIEDATSADLRDYKFFAFNGHVDYMFIASNRQVKDKETCFDFYDRDFHHIDVRNGHPNATPFPERPNTYNQMLKAAEVLSAGLPHVRVDFYEVNGHCYFGELTLYHWGGLIPFEPDVLDKKMGDLITVC